MNLPPVEALIARLAHENPTWRADAETALIARGDAAVPALIAALHHPSLTVRVHAIRCLGRVRAIAGAEPVAAFLGSKELGIAMAAQRTLADLGAVETVVGVVTHSRDFSAVARALRALEIIGDPRGSQAATGALSSASPEVRAQAVTTLLALTGAAGVEASLPLLEDPEKLVRYAAAMALAPLKVLRARPVLLEAAMDPDEEGETYEALIGELDRATAAP